MNEPARLNLPEPPGKPEPARKAMSPADKGFWLGALGVLIFSFTLPVTKLATDAPGHPGLSPAFLTFGRAAVAGLLSIGYLWFVSAARPDLPMLKALILAGGGIVIGFPLFQGLALQYVEAMHASVISGALPLGTAALGALWTAERARPAFWVLAVLGFALVVLYAWISGEGGFVPADGLLLLAVLSASCGYVLGARLTGRMPPEQIISWILVLYLPLTLPAMWWFRPPAPAAVLPQAWLGFGYLAVFSMWLGFFAWYGGLKLGGTLRVSQVQLAQPFLSMVVAVPLLGERLSLLSLGFCAAIVGTIALSRRISGR